MEVAGFVHEDLSTVHNWESQYTPPFLFFCATYTSPDFGEANKRTLHVPSPLRPPNYS